MTELVTTFAVRENGGIRRGVEGTRGFGGRGAAEVTDFSREVRDE